MIVSRGWGEEGMGSHYLMGTDVTSAGPENWKFVIWGTVDFWESRQQKQVNLIFSMLVEMFSTGRTTEWLLFWKSTWNGERIRLANWTTLFKRTWRNGVLAVENWVINKKRNLLPSIGNLSVNGIIQKAKNREVAILKFINLHEEPEQNLIPCYLFSATASSSTMLPQLKQQQRFPLWSLA